MNLVPVGELKPRDFFRYSPTSEIRMRLQADGDNVWYVQRMADGGYHCFTMFYGAKVQPLPECDSFDWTPPRERTALELAKRFRSAYLVTFEKQNCPKQKDFDAIIAAMELEAKK